ncbi:dihydrolipoyl dehydrogenase family protein [Salinarimonas ramus]|uniref:Dihydrolipoamide dehydrogenase n=1 Tax=Salinarimonas ramus TaxID=690164 RepID=A0A917V2L2_9HYPH|nr:FAD-dependent oxidoreductase [Salinarimonas ramus]GGK23501.1 dihydrolipoamide dehydrogenase [Salinarimonas ramus]
MSAATSDILHADICVIGGGSGGLSVAAGAAQMGARVVLVEKHKMGGDCLNYGCVPSKALLAAAHAAQAVRTSGRFGVNGHEPAIDFLKVRDHVQGVIAGIAPHDSPERFRGLGVTVIEAPARFLDARTVEAGGRRIVARRFVVATGSSPAVPPIPGLSETPYFTNETLFDNAERIDRLIVVGGGPIGLEMAQAHRRLGSAVTVLDAGRVLVRDDAEAAAIVRDRLGAEGVDIREYVKIERVERAGNGVAVTILEGGETTRIEGSHLLVAAGRRANVAGLDLDAAGIAYTPRGVTVDDRLRTTNKRVFAIGDVAGGPQFTHVAGYHAGIVVRQALFHLPAKADHSAVPWVTYADPELAHVGLTAAEAEKSGVPHTVARFTFAENDRARAERETEGFAKVVVGKGGRVLGATIVGAHAGELILPWVLAVTQKLKIAAVASAIAPYPTLSEVSKRAAGAHFTPSLFSERTRKVVRFLQRWT